MENTSKVNRRTVLLATAWSVPTVALAVGVPGAAASPVSLRADPAALTAYIGETTFATVTLSAADPRSGEVVLALSGTTFSDGSASDIRLLSAAGTLEVSDILVPDAASTGTLTASLASDPTVQVSVPLTAVDPEPGYALVSLTADQGVAFTSVQASILVSGSEASPSGAQLTVTYDETSLALSDIQTNPQSTPSWSSLASPATATLASAITPGMLVVTFYFGRVSQVPAEVTVTADLGTTQPFGPTTRSIITS